MVVKNVSSQTLLYNPTIQAWTTLVLAEEVYPLGYESLAYQAYLAIHRPAVILVICQRFKEMEELAAKIKLHFTLQVKRLLIPSRQILIYPHN